MVKKIFSLIFTSIILFNGSLVMAAGEGCDPTNELLNNGCAANLFCKQTPNGNENQGICEEKIKIGGFCNPTDEITNHGCDAGLFCKQTPNGNEYQGGCEKGTGSFQDIFGRIIPPNPLRGLLEKDPTGAGAISQFITNGITLIYSIAAVILLLMIIWGAFEWLTSGGDKEAIAKARGRIINAVIGIILFAVAFAIISVIGTFTGFKFFEGQGVTIKDKGADGSYVYVCPDGSEHFAKPPSIPQLPCP